jgi:hypothetical protein
MDLQERTDCLVSVAATGWFTSMNLPLFLFTHTTPGITAPCPCHALSRHVLWPAVGNT